MKCNTPIDYAMPASFGDLCQYIDNIVLMDYKRFTFVLVSVPEQQEWVDCPFTGGYDFQAYVKDKKPVRFFPVLRFN